MKHLMRHAIAVATTAALAVTLAPGQAHAADTPADDLAATWLGTQLTDGLIFNDQFGGFTDYGLSIDVALGLKQVGGYDTTVQAISDALAPKINSYTTGVDFGSSDIYAGATAKATVLAQTVGANPAAYGGVNLVTRLNQRISTTLPSKGRLQDKGAMDYANVIGQIYAVQGLTTASASRRGPALRYLLKQQCAKGYFRLNFTKSKTAKDQTCDGGNPATTSAPDTDATAQAVIMLDGLHSTDPAVKAALGKAVTWLKARQKANGSFGGGTSTEGSNTNSTGLAGWALGARGSCTKAAKAAAWIKALQVTSATSGSPLAADIGATAYNKAAYDGVVAAEEITGAQRDQWRRATAQAAPALANAVVADCQAR